MSAPAQATPRDATATNNVGLVKCRYCHELLTLKTDSAEARLRHEDPYQQIRAHLQSHPQYLAPHAYNMVLLIDALAFESPHDPNLWHRHLEELLSYCESMEIKT